MTSNEIVVRVIEALEKHDVPYMIVGAYSSNAFGISRSTQDADFVIELRDRSPTPLFDELKDILQFDPQLRLETVTATTRWVGRAIGGLFTVELFQLTDDPHNQERFARRQKQPFLSIAAWLPTKEDVVIQKLRWFERARRAKDLDDTRNILAVQATKLDWDYLRKWTSVHGTLHHLDRLISELP